MTQPVDNESFQVGGVLQPVETSTRSLLFRADPTLAYALDFFSWIIRNYPGDSLLLAAITKAGLKDPKDRPVSDAVGMAFPEDPVPYLASAYLRFPCLAMYRKSARYKKHSAGYNSENAQFDLIYILPPLTAGQAENILPILRVIESAIRAKTVQSFDPQYTPPGGTEGDSPWGLQYAAVQEIGFEGSSRGQLPVGNMIFPCLTMSGFVIERDMPLPGQHKFTGGDVSANLIGASGTVVSPFIQLATLAGLSLASITPAKGSHAGGTGITLAGAGFLHGATVTIGAFPASSVVVSTDGTSLTCVTPHVDGTGPVDVHVINPDGSEASLTQAFTFTSP